MALLKNNQSDDLTLKYLLQNASGGGGAKIHVGDDEPTDANVNIWLDTDEPSITINVLEQVYPVGSIYMSVNNVSPATLFGGTWQQIKDTFLLSAGDTYTAGDTGGEATHTLLENEMPSHSHAYAQYKGYAGWSGTSPQANFLKTTGNDGYSSTDNNGYMTTLSKGSSQAHNNMPPYLVVYMWRRTA